MKTDSIHIPPYFARVFVKYRYVTWFITVLLLVILVFARYDKNTFANVDKKGKIFQTLNQDRLEYFLANFSSLEAFRVEDVLEMDNFDYYDNNEAKELVFRTLGFPLQGECKVLKRVGGKWLNNPGVNKQVDGDKFICLDNLINAKNNETCIIYSFGIAKDWSFEDFMDTLGCRIFAYDPTIDSPPQRGKNIQFFKVGVGNKLKEQNRVKILNYKKLSKKDFEMLRKKKKVNMKTLKTIFQENNHTNSPVEYLKIDIEGGEFHQGGFSDWFTTEVLDNVHQIALELHLPRNGGGAKMYIYLLRILRELYRIGFRLISQEVNMPVGPDKTGYYTHIEVVFMKTKREVKI